MYRILSILAVTFVMTACDDGTNALSPEATHCAGVAGLATQTYGEITVTALKEEVLGEIKHVGLTFNYPKTHPEFTSGQIQCSYPFGGAEAVNPDRIVKVADVHVRGRYLSADELKFVNSSLFKPRPLFKLKDKGLF